MKLAFFYSMMRIQRILYHSFLTILCFPLSRALNLRTFENILPITRFNFSPCSLWNIPNYKSLFGKWVILCSFKSASGSTELNISKIFLYFFLPIYWRNGWNILVSCLGFNWQSSAVSQLLCSLKSLTST